MTQQLGNQERCQCECHKNLDRLFCNDCAEVHGKSPAICQRCGFRPKDSNISVLLSAAHQNCKPLLENHWEERFRKIDCCPRGCEHTATIGELIIADIKSLRQKDKERLLKGVDNLPPPPLFNSPYHVHRKDIIDLITKYYDQKST